MEVRESRRECVGERGGRGRVEGRSGTEERGERANEKVLNREIVGEREREKESEREIVKERERMEKRDGERKRDILRKIDS